MSGKVIAIVAPTRSGKTFLVERLVEHYGAHAEFELENGVIPAPVEDALALKIHAANGWLYFRNRSVRMHLSARARAQSGQAVFLDASWISNEPYLDFYRFTGFEREQFKALYDIDAETLPWPDAIILLHASDAACERIWRSSGRTFESDTLYFRERLLPLKHAFEKYMKTLNAPCPIIEIDRSDLDFTNPVHVHVVTEKLDPILSG